MKAAKNHVRFRAHTLTNVFRNQQPPCGNRGQNVAGKLRLRNREEDDDLRNPYQQKRAQRVLPGISEAANCGHQRGNREHGPRHPSEENHRNVIPERLGMMKDIGTETREIVLQNEYAKELRILELHENVPRQSDETEDNDPGKPQTLPGNMKAALYCSENRHHHYSQKWRDRTLRQHPKSEQRVKSSQVSPITTFKPCIPRQH